MGAKTDTDPVWFITGCSTSLGRALDCCERGFPAADSGYSA